jgi:colanic acid/amylovoran biosynthesis protein
MVEEKRESAYSSYLKFLVQVCETLEHQDAKVLFLLFESRDRDLLSPVSKVLGREVVCVEEDDPVRLRGVLGEAQGVIASRYHVLVSALSQGSFCSGNIMEPQVRRTAQRLWLCRLADSVCQ